MADAVDASDASDAVFRRTLICSMWYRPISLHTWSVYASDCNFCAAR